MLLLFVLLASAQIRIQKITRGTNGGAILTFKNFGTQTVDVTGYYVRTDHQSIPIHSTENNSVQAGGNGPRIPGGGQWSIDYTGWINQGSGGGKLSQSSDVGLWLMNPTAPGVSVQSMIDFVQYCNRGSSGQATCPDFGDYDLAASRGLWDVTNTDRHVGYIYPGELTFTGADGSERGRRFWSSNVVTLSTTSTTSTTTTSNPTPPTPSPTTRILSTTPTPSPTRIQPTSTAPAPTTMSVNAEQCALISARLTRLFWEVIGLRQDLNCY